MERGEHQDSMWDGEVLDSQGAVTVHLLEGEQSVQHSVLPLEEVTPQCFHGGEICRASMKLQEEIKPEWC